MNTLHRALLAMILLLPAAANAQDAETAASLQSQLRAWFSSWPGAAARASAPLRVEADADHYRFEWPVTVGSNQPEADFTASIRPLDGGRWAVDSLQLSPSEIDVTLPAPAAQPGVGPTQVSLTLSGQSGQAEIDPSFASTSTLALSVDDLSVVTDNAFSHQIQHMDHYAMHGSLSPAPNGRVDVAADGSAARWHISAQPTKGPAIEAGARAVQGGYQVAGVSRAAATALVGAVGGLMTLLPGTDQPPPDAVQVAALHKALRAIIEALRDSVTSLRSDGTMDDLQVSVAGLGDFNVRHVRTGMEGEAPDDRLHADWDIALEGISVPDLPPAMAGLIPSEISLRPGVSGINMAMLTELVVDATAERPDQAEITQLSNALLTNPRAQFGIQSMSVTLGPARLTGHGQVHFLAPGQPVLSARLTATGTDALMAQAGTQPAVQKIVPLLAMLRGMARPEGNQLVWEIEASKGRATVNGIDVSQFAGAMKK